jgi:ATP:corrinoid adenosyltransferase
MHALGMAERAVGSGPGICLGVYVCLFIKRKEKRGLINIPNMTYRNRNHIELCFQPQLQILTRKTEDTRLRTYPLYV